MQSSPSNSTGKFTGSGSYQTWVFLLINLVAAYFFTQLRLELGHENPRASYVVLTDFTGFLPFQARVLIPALIRLTGSLLGGQIAPMQLARIIDYFAMVLAVLGLRRYLRAWLSPYSCSLGALLLYLLLLFHYFFTPPGQRILYPYDLPALAFITWGLVFGRERNWKFYYPLFFFACLNRETACLLTLGHTAASLTRRKIPGWWPHFTAQLLIWCGCWVGLRYLFLGNPGVIFEDHFDMNILRLSHSPSWVLLASSFGYQWALILVFWRRIPAYLKKQLITVPFLLSLMVFVGNINELRIYGELIPFVATAAWVGWASLLSDVKKAGFLRFWNRGCG
ncbi:MAG: hypothetical protein ACE1ZI_00925 [Acidobacteriota bacterium]